MAVAHKLLYARQGEKGAALCEFKQSERRTSRARPAEKFRQEFYRKANPVLGNFYCLHLLRLWRVTNKATCDQILGGWNHSNGFLPHRDLQAGALCEFECLWHERRVGRGGVASAARQ